MFTEEVNQKVDAINTTHLLFNSQK